MKSRQRYRPAIYLLFGIAMATGTGLALLRPVDGSGVWSPKSGVRGRPGAETPDSGPRTPDRAPAARIVEPTHEFVRFPTPPEFEEIQDGHFEVQTPLYKAALSAGEGLRYRPLAPGQSETCGQVQVRLSTVSRGGNTIFDRASDGEADCESAVSDGACGLSFWRAPGFEEHYLPRGDGVEQSFILEEKPEGAGDLEFSCELALQNLTALPPRPLRAGGICFADAGGRIAARYGQVVVRDSAQNGIVVEPRLSAGGARIAFAVPGAWLEQARYPVVVDPLVGGELFLTTNLPTLVAPPTIAASSTNYLVCWSDFRAATPQVFASIVTQSGVPTPDFPISNAAGRPRDYRNQRIASASDGTGWLVVWSDDRAVAPGIRGSIVLPNGAVLDGDDFLIAPTSGLVEEDPLVVFNGVDYFVAWNSTPPGLTTGSQVYLTRVTTNKTVGAIQVIAPAATPINQSLLFLAPQRPSGDTLILYRENGDTPAQTRSIRVGTDGTARDPLSTALFRENVTDGGFGRPIGAVFAGNEWLILSSFNQLQDSSIFLHKLSTSGAVTPPAGVFAEMGVGPIGSSLDEYAPAFAGNGEWLFVRNERVSSTLYHLIGKRVTFTGEDKDPLPFQLDTSTQGVLRNPVAAFAGTFHLVAWLDGRSGGAQPGDARDIAAALVDTTSAAAAGTALVSVAAASPTSGEAPLDVNFSSAGSRGSFDSLLWDFGDGTTSTEAAIAHTYRSNGTYIATLRLNKGPYFVQDRVVINVGVAGTSGPGGGTRIGTPVDNSPGLITTIFIGAATIRLDFAQTGNDVARISGVADPGLLPDSLTGTEASVSIGSFRQAFSLDAKGAAGTNTTKFQVNPQKGAFIFEAVQADLRAAMDALGLKNQTIKPPIGVQVPITVTIGTLSGAATVGLSYRATLDTGGIGTYVFLQDGDEVTGSFLISKFSAKESGSATKVHTYAIKGQAVRPNGGIFKPGSTGEFRFSLGTFSTGIPVGLLVGGKGKLNFGVKAKKEEPGGVIPGGFFPPFFLTSTEAAAKGLSGLKKFTIDLNSGIFSLQFQNVPAEGAGGTGLPPAKSGSNVVKADLNLSFQFDLETEKFNAGRFIFISRKDANAKTWKLR